MACEFLFEGNWYTEDELKEVFSQQGKDKTTEPTKASAATIKMFREFLDRIDVKVEGVDKIIVNGKILGINGIAYPMRGLIQYVNGKEDTVLPEEAMHMAVEIIEQKNPALFKEMMNKVGSYNLTAKVFAQYKNNPFYQKDGKPDIVKIKKEAIGKILAQTVIEKNENAKESAELLNQTRTWWQKIIDFLKSLFLKAGMNPFQEVASQVLSGKDIGKIVKPVTSKVSLVNAFSHVYDIMYKGEKIGKMDLPLDLEGNTVSIGDIEINPEFRGKGLGVEAYKAAMLLSDRPIESSIASDEANRVWDSLVRQGYAKKNPEGGYITVKPEVTSKESAFANRNPNAVNASMKLISSLRDPKAFKWFDTLYKKGQKDLFFSKLQQDLQAPKNQVDLLKKWIQDNDPQSVADMITGVMAELSYVVEVNVATQKARTSAEETAELRSRGMTPEEIEKEIGTEPTFRYSNLTVDGGVNYRENEIKTPDITPTIKGHAAFSTNQGIGWFRSDDMAKPNTFIPVEISTGNYSEGEPSKTRRILEVQSDLFQKSRPRWDETLQGWKIGDETYATKEQAERVAKIKSSSPQISNVNQYGLSLKQYIETLINQGLPTDVIVRGVVEDYPGIDKESMHFTYPDFQPEFRGDEGPRPLTTLDEVVYQLNQISADTDSQNNFLNLLSDENNWVTFFVKAIIQDSAKKGYENVRFPVGDTAAKIEGHTTLEGYISERERLIKESEEGIEYIRDEIKKIEKTGEFSALNATYYIKDGKYYESPHSEARDKSIEITKDFYDTNYENHMKFIQDSLEKNERAVTQFQKEIDDARGPEGMGKLSAIAKFYENTIHNILKKQGYKPQEITDEYNNKWFEVALKEDRDLGDFYFQISGTQDLADKIKEKNVNISKRGAIYEINGSKIGRTVQKEVEDFYVARLGHNLAEIFFKDFRRETENKLQIDLRDIIDRRVDENGKLRDTPLPQTNPSAVDPNDNTMYQTLDGSIEQRLASYEAGTVFLNAPNIYDGKVVGTPDLIAITPTGQVDVLQFKAVEATRTGDVKVFQQQAYNTEIEAFRRILERGYGIDRKNFRFTRAIPIKADYEPIVPGFKEKRLARITIGDVNVKLIQDEMLFPIASRSETTGNKKFDAFIDRLRGLIQRLSSERVPPEKRLEKAQRIASLVAAVKKLQIKKDASGILTSAKTIIKAQKEKYKMLQDKISNTDPSVASIKELNKIAADILDDKDQVQIYSDLHQVFKKVFDDGTAESQDTIKEAREISEDARDIAADYLEMSINFRIKKFSAKIGIKDEFNPEKKITWYRRMVRSLSQSPLKAGAALWSLVKRINNSYELQFLDRLKELSEIKEKVDKWLEGKTLNDLYHKIFQYDEKGRWNGRVIQKFSKDFYSELTKALERRDMAWVRDNIDVEEYNKWMVKEHQRLIDNSSTARVHEDDTENSRLIMQGLQDFADTYNINFPKGISTKNDKLKNFPLRKWYSPAYNELLETGNEPIKELYDYWEKRLKESWESGMFHDYVGKDWFPNVRRGFMEKMTTAKADDKLASLFGNIRIESEDSVFGKIDPLTGKPVDEIHARFVRDLGEVTKDADDEYFKDYSGKSMDIFKVIGLWDTEILKYQLRTESEGLARLLHYTEQNKQIIPTTPTGKVMRSKETGEPVEPIDDETNAKYLKEHIDAIFYGKKRSNEFDVAFNIPYKSAVEKINKLFGKEMLPVPEKDDIRVSGTKLIESMNRYFVTKTLGLNLMTSIAQLFGGTTNVLINQGLYFNKKDIAEAELKYVSNRFWGNEEDKKMAGLIGFIHPFLEDRTSHELRALSVSGWIKHLSSDHLFFLQRGADNWINTIVGMSMIKNTMVADGKLVNIRDFARKELGHDTKFDGSYEDSKDFEDRLEKRVEELKKSPEALLNISRIENDKMVIPGVDRASDTMIDYRQRILEIIKDALGNVSSEDLALYKRSIVGQSFFMFKNWIPRMADVRFQSLKFQPGTNKYEYGRVRMLWNAVLSKNRTSIGGLIKLLSVNNSEGVVETAKKEYQKKKSEFSRELDDLDMTEAEFVDMYVKGVRSELREVAFAVSLMALLISARAMEPDEDEHVKGAYRWALRGLDKLTDELTFLYSPSSFTNILNGSVFPAVGILAEAEKFIQTIIEKLYYEATGQDEKADRKKVSKYLFRMFPVTKELITYVAIFNNDLAKEYGLKINTNYGSIR